jgi:hypothetical protein
MTYDLKQPRPKASRIAALPQPEIRAREGLLACVLRIIRVRRQTPSNRKRRIEVPADQDRKGIVIPRKRPRDEFGVTDVA